MPGLGRGGMLPGVARGPRSSRLGAGRSPRGPPGPGRSPPGRAGRSPRGPPGPGVLGAAGCWLAPPPPPTPNGLLPTRGDRGPGLGDCRLGGTTAPLCCAAAGCCCAGRACCCCRSGDRIGSTTGACGSAAAAAGAGSAVLAGRAGPGAPGLGPGRLLGAGAPFGRAAGAAGAVCGTAGATVGAGVAGRAGATGPGAVWAGAAAAAAGAGDAGLGAASRLPPPARLDRLGPSALGNESRNLRATGASTVEDADFTNSPRSFNLARTSLLVTPSSLASSCTRALPATALLIREVGGLAVDLVLLSRVHGFSFTADS
jgi:hypothetical protein